MEETMNVAGATEIPAEALPFEVRRQMRRRQLVLNYRGLRAELEGAFPGAGISRTDVIRELIRRGENMGYRYSSIMRLLQQSES